MVEPGEVHAGQLRAVEDQRRQLAARAGDEVDDAGRQARLFQHQVGVVGRQELGLGRLPQDGVAHQRRRRGQVAADRGEVERREGEDEALERAQLEHVPGAGRAGWLLGVQALGVGRVEAPEVDQLAGRVNLGLVAGLGLPQHGGGVDRVAVRAGEQLGGAEEDRGARLPRHRRPLALGLGAVLDRPLDLGRAGQVRLGQHVAVAVGHGDVNRAARGHPLAADDAWDFDRVGGHSRELGFERRFLGAAGGVGPDGLVLGLGQAHDRVVHGRLVP